MRGMLWTSFLSFFSWIWICGGGLDAVRVVLRWLSASVDVG